MENHQKTYWRSGRSFRMCPILAKSIASQLVKNGAHRTGGRESPRLINEVLQKTVSATFHLNNKEAKLEFKVKYNNEILPFCCEPKYVGVTLDRSLTYRRHLESLRKKLTSRVALLRQLAGSGWGAGATTLQIATLALVHSTTEYCDPVLIPASSTRPSRTPCELWLDACVLHQ